MFARIRNFFYRHRRKFFIAGIFAGGAVFLTKYAQWKLAEFRDREACEFLSHAKKQHHFDSNQRTCNMTVLSMLPALRENLMELLNTEKLTLQLKTKPVNKLQIWSELKIVSFARTVCTVYGCCLLVVILRVQLNVIGGYMYLDSQASAGENGVVASKLVTSEIQHHYLELIQHLLGAGLTTISARVMEACKSALHGVGLKKGVSLSDLKEVFDHVRADVESESLTELIGHALPDDSIGLVAGEEDGAAACQQDAHRQRMLEQLMVETKDMLESSDCLSILHSSLDTGFTRVLDNISEFYIPPEPQAANGFSSGHLVDTSNVKLPLAKVIPVVNGQIHSICSKLPNGYVQELLMTESIKNFGANVYEAFSQPAAAVSK